MNYTKKLYIVFHQGFDKHNAQLYWALYSALDCTRALESFSCFPFFASSLRVSMFCITLPHTFCRFLSSAHLFFRVVVLYSLLLRRFFAVHFFVSAGFSLRPCWYLLLLFTSVHTHTHTHTHWSFSLALHRIWAGTAPCLCSRFLWAREKERIESVDRTVWANDDTMKNVLKCKGMESKKKRATTATTTAIA